MWAERVVRRVADPQNHDWSKRSVDFVDVAWNACGRVLKSTTRGGEAVRVLLPAGERLHHGDVIFEDATRVVVIIVPACELIVARPANAAAAARLALELGNLLFVEDGPPLAAADGLGIAWTRELRRFEPAVVSGGSVPLAGQFEIIRAEAERE
jgi:hypothetical protein